MWIFTGSGSRFHLEDLGREAGVQQEHVARLDDDVVGRHDLLERLAVDAAPVVAEVVGQVDEDASPLHAVEGHVLQAEVVREAAVVAAVARGVGLRSDEVDAGAVAVVVDGLLDRRRRRRRTRHRRARASPTASSTAARASPRRRPTRRRSAGRPTRPSRSCGRCRRWRGCPPCPRSARATGGYRRWFKAVPPG